MDNCTAAQYATQLSYYATTIKGADPTARIVGPNALNWDYTCSDCTDYGISQSICRHDDPVIGQEQHCPGADQTPDIGVHGYGRVQRTQY